MDHDKAKTIGLNSDDFPFSMARVEAADVIVGYPGGVVSSATGFPDKAIVLIPRLHTPGGHGLSARQAHDVVSGTPSGKLVLNADSTIVCHNPRTDLAKAVRQAAEHTEANRARARRRREYFQRMYSCIDGNEDTRIALLILRDRLGLNTRHLEGLYARIHGAAPCKIEWSLRNWMPSSLKVEDVLRAHQKLPPMKSTKMAGAPLVVRGRRKTTDK